MRVFHLSTLIALAFLNGFLGYSGSVLSYEVHRVVAHSGVELSNISRLAFAVQPRFYLLAFVSLVFAVLGFANKLPERLPAYLIVLFMALDIIGLLISAWGFGLVHFLM